jgi:hypothetical protein
VTIGLILLGLGVTLLVLSLAVGDFKVGFRQFAVSVAKLARNEPFRLVILVLGVVSILAGGSVLVRTAVEVPAAEGGPFAKTTTTAYAGPSTQGYNVIGTVPVNTRVRVICTAYGQPGRFDDRVVSLWDYTDRGWLNDHYVSTGTTEPTAAGCIGSTGKPQAGSTRTTVASGPYAVITDEGSRLPVRTEPNPSAQVIQQLPAGQFVRLQCTLTQGPVIPAPRALGPAHSNNVWDRIATPSGWVPDSFVATYSAAPVAPPC